MSVGDPETFCVYCQHQFTSRGRFVRHVVTQHRNTYAYWRVLTDAERES